MSIHTAVEKRLYDIQETCQALGLSKPSVYRFIATGDLESVMVGRRRFTTPSALDAFIERLRAKGAPMPRECVSNRWRKKGTTNEAVKPARPGDTG